MLSAGCALPGARYALASNGSGGTAREFKFGAQTNAWAIDPKNFESLLGVLAQVKEIGYSGFETGFLNVRSQFANAAAGRKQLEQTGLTFFGMHVFLPRRYYDPETNLPPATLYRQLAPGGAALGAHHLIFSGAPAQNRKQLEQKIAGLDAAGKFCRSAGIHLAYHNETAEESQSSLGELAALYQRTDPQYVSFLLDCGHAYQGGMDVPNFAAQHYKRIIGLHLRDYKNGTQVVLGRGGFPLAALAANLRHVRWSGWVLNEEERLDGSKHGAEFMKPALRAAKGAFLA
jgi:inosose dehydratase